MTAGDYPGAASAAFKAGNAQLGLGLLELGNQATNRGLATAAAVDMGTMLGAGGGGGGGAAPTPTASAGPAASGPSRQADLAAGFLPGGLAGPLPHAQPAPAPRAALSTAPEAIRTAAEQHGPRRGVSADYLVRTAGIESSFDPNARNPKSPATGLYQFMPGTAFRYGLADPTNVTASAEAAAKLAADNRMLLRSRVGRDPSDAELYSHTNRAAAAPRRCSRTRARTWWTRLPRPTAATVARRLRRSCRTAAAPT